MEVVKEPYNIVFTNNPVVFEFKTDSLDPVFVNVHIPPADFGLMFYPYTHAFQDYRVKFDIADILRSRIGNPFNEIGIITNSDLKVYYVLCGDYTFTGRALPGGISKSLIRTFHKSQTNIFTGILLNRTRQFLMTTRSFGNTLYYRRNEIESICLISNISQKFSIITNLGTQYEIVEYPLKALYINLRTMISGIGNEQSGINQLDFIFNNNTIFKIVISDSFSEESYLFRFRNSYGVLDMIEFTGKGTYTPDFLSDETYNTYNSVLEDLEETRERVPRREILQIETGYKMQSEFMFLRDFLASKEMYLVNRVKNEITPCIVTGDLSHNIRQFQPESMSLKVRFVDDEFNYSADDYISTYKGQLYTNTGKKMITNTGKLIILNN